MPAKKSNAVKRVPHKDFRARMHETARRHPIVTWSGIAALIGVMVSLGPAALWAVNYYVPRYEAAATEAQLRAVITDVQKKADRNLAWSSVQAIKTEISVANNRTNDCEIREEKREKMSALEHTTCNDYRAALNDALARFENAKRTALELSK